MARSLFVRASTSAAADRLLREAAAYHERLLARLGEGNRRLELSLGHAGSDEDVLIDTALYYATSERQGQAELLVRRDRAAMLLPPVLAATIALAAAALRRASAEPRRSRGLRRGRTAAAASAQRR